MRRLCLIIIVVFFGGFILYAIDTQDSLLTSFELAETEFDKMVAASKLAKFYNQDEALDRAHQYANMGLELAKLQHDNKYILQNTYVLGTIDMNYGDYSGALTKFQTCIDLNEQVGDSIILGKTLYSIGMVYWLTEHYNMALQFLHESAKYDNLNNENADYNRVITLFTLGSVYSDMRLDSAVTYMNQALNLARRKGYPEMIATIYNNLGDHYLLRHDYEKAEKCFNVVLNDYIEFIDSSFQALLYGNLATTHAHLGQLEKAKHYANINLELTQKQATLENIRFSKQVQFEIDSIEGNYQSALRNYQLSIKYKDSILSKEVQDKLVNFESLYGLNKQESEIKQLKDQNELNELKLKNQRLLVYSLFGIALLLITLLSVIILENRLRNRLNGELQNVNNELQTSSDKLKQQNQTLQETNMSKDRFISIIAHDLKNPLNSLLSLSKMFYYDFEELSDLRKMKIAGMLNDSTIKVFQLLEDLLQWSRANTNSIKYNPINTDICQLVVRAIEYLAPTANKKGIRIENMIEPKTQVITDQHMVFTILRNLISNAIKFSYPGTRIVIKLIERNDKLEILVVDKGIGMTDKMQTKLFKIDQTFSTKGTQGELGTGLGLIICKEFIDACNGEIIVHSKKEEGSTFGFTLPKLLQI